MFFKQKIVLGDIFIVEVGNSHIEQNIQQQRKIEKGKIHPVVFVAYKVLHTSIDTKNPKWFYQKIEGKK